MPKKAMLLSAAPVFENHNVTERVSLQKTDLRNNNNKFYIIEIQKSGSEFRVFTHYGRTDYLANDSNYGTKHRSDRKC